MKTLFNLFIILFLNFLPALYSCESKKTNSISQAHSIVSQTDYLESTIAIKEILGRDYLDTSFTLFDSITDLKNGFLDSSCLAYILKDSIVAKTELLTTSNLNENRPSVWSETSTFKFRMFKSTFLDSLNAARIESQEIYEKAFGRGFWRITYPLFSQDRNYCIIGLRFNCGPVCGSSKAVLCKRIGDKWVIVKSLCEGVS